MIRHHMATHHIVVRERGKTGLWVAASLRTYSLCFQLLTIIFNNNYPCFGLRKVSYNNTVPSLSLQEFSFKCVSVVLVWKVIGHRCFWFWQTQRWVNLARWGKAFALFYIHWTSGSPWCWAVVKISPAGLGNICNSIKKVFENVLHILIG